MLVALKKPTIEDDLQTAVGALGDIFSIDSFKNLFAACDQALWDRREVQAERREYEKALADALRIHGNVADRWGTEPREVKAARSALAQAETRDIAAGARLNAATERRDEQFLKLVMPKIEEAMPTLQEVANLVNQTVTSLSKLYSFAAGRQLPLPRMLMATPTLCDASRSLVACINFASAPAHKDDVRSPDV
jgi:hypothetical protein